MKRIAGYFLAAFFGGLLSLATLSYFQDGQLDKLKKIEELKAENSDVDNNHQVSYGLPLESVDFVNRLDLCLI